MAVHKPGFLANLRARTKYFRKKPGFFGRSTFRLLITDGDSRFCSEIVCGMSGFMR
jgi:hypothetical protein